MDFEAVPFDLYLKDMNELGDRAGGIIRKLRRDLKDRDRLIMAMVEAAGGRLKINDFQLEGVDGKELVWERYEYDRTTRFTVRPSPSQTPSQHSEEAGE